MKITQHSAFFSINEIVFMESSSPIKNKSFKIFIRYFKSNSHLIRLFESNCVA